jgi:acyl-CoA dehydrogenase
MDEYVYPNETTYEAQHKQLTKEAGHPWVNAPILETLKAKAKAAGLWNLFMAKNPTHPHSFGAGLTNLEYAPLCEIMGRSLIAPEGTLHDMHAMAQPGRLITNPLLVVPCDQSINSLQL